MQSPLVRTAPIWRTWKSEPAFLLLLAFMAAALLGCAAVGQTSTGAQAHVSLQDDGRNWPGYGRTLEQQHYSPLAEIDQSNIAVLGLAWSMDLAFENTATQPIAVDGILYFATGLSIVHAVDALTGEELWKYDPEAGERAGLNLRLGWGVRGVAWWDGKIYTGTQDGRLIAIDAKSGTPVWSVQTFPSDMSAYISGAPRVFDGKVVIGFGGTTGPTRGYVTAYDAKTGEQLWRFYTTPGNPSEPFENEAMEMAAKTWAGEWWKYGGGADVWNAIAYDEGTDTIFIGTGSGYPWNRRVRSEDKGDNLFVASIVALEGESGAYKWHYQTTPGDTWDFDAAMDIELADIEIDGKLRKVIIQAPKNGFFYVIDRVTGELISAEPFVKTTWASRIDLETGRPVEAPDARYPDGKAAEIWPTALGAHSWLPMAYSPQTELAYIPAVEMGFIYRDSPREFELPADRTVDGGVLMMPIPAAAGGAPALSARLIAWSPIEQKVRWAVEHPTYLNGGVLATGGELVFQGTVEGMLRAYAADTGKLLWEFDARAPIIGTPISYEVGGRQYVTILTGMGMNYPASAAALHPDIEKYGIDPRSQARRVLTFVLGGKAQLPARPAVPAAVRDPSFMEDRSSMMLGALGYATRCATCHGGLVVGSGHGPDLRRSPIPVSQGAYLAIVRDGLLVKRGMPAFPDVDAAELEAIRQYIRSQADQLRRSGDEGSKKGVDRADVPFHSI